MITHWLPLFHTYPAPRFKPISHMHCNPELSPVLFKATIIFFTVLKEKLEPYVTDGKDNVGAVHTSNKYSDEAAKNHRFEPLWFFLHTNGKDYQHAGCPKRPEWKFSVPTSCQTKHWTRFTPSLHEFNCGRYLCIKNQWTGEMTSTLAIPPETMDMLPRQLLQTTFTPTQQKQQTQGNSKE